MKLTLDQTLQKGVEAHKAGKLKEADQYYTAILKANPKHPDANHNMGVLAVGVGKVEQALPFFKKALEANSKIEQFWLSYLDTLIKLNQIDEAKAVFDQAIGQGVKAHAFEKIEKQLSFPSKNSQAREPSQKELDLLLELYNENSFQQVFKEANSLTKRYTNSVTVWNLIGASAAQIGKLDEAVLAFQKAVRIKPYTAELYNNMANALIDQGKTNQAIEAYIKAISLKSDYAEPYNNIAISLKNISFTKPNRNLLDIITLILERKSLVRPRDITNAGISLLKFEPNLNKHLQLADNEMIESPADVISDLHEFPLLLKLMSVCPLHDLELEGLFTKLRCSILLNLSSLKDASVELFRFQSALAMQCFTNEYIYNHTEEEEKILKSLEASVRLDLNNNEQPSLQLILALASYKAINEYDWYNLLEVTDEIKEVFIRQIEEPNQEEHLKQNLPILEEITDSISSEVRAQYEESPYPRWVNLGLPLKPFSILEVVDQVKLKLHDIKVTGVEKPKILVAGCGTGQHSIGTAARFKGSKVLAIDLSLSSLAYAKRKTDELGIENIKYMQADILDLGKLNKQFDIIESAGVLHHMDNPIAGWKILTDCLKPGGLMKIGLYSELARQHIVKIREEISKAGIGSSDAEMKSFRNTIMGSNKYHHKQIMTSTDFYSLSEFRDLLFHVQEHRFTIPKIEGHLKKLGLKFCGFETNSFSHFKQKNKHKEDLYDLNKWQSYEEANPRTFAGMYALWCQKVE